jgi:hypothetical protein
VKIYGPETLKVKNRKDKREFKNGRRCEVKRRTRKDKRTLES